MAYSPDIKGAVRSSYINEQLDLKAACAKHGVGYQTGRAWKKKAKDDGDDWDTARNALLLAQGGKKELINQVLERFFIQSERIFKALEEDESINPQQGVDLMAKWTDSVSKISKLLGTSNDFSKIAFALELLQLLASFIQQNFPHHAEVFLEILEPFGQEVSKVYG